MAGASCLSNGSFIPLVAGSSWEVSHGIYKLVSCPAGHQLINSSDGSSKGIFSQESQFCKPCMPGQYIIDPKNGICQDCPDGTTYLPFNLNLTGRVKACTSNQDFPVFSTLFTILCPLMPFLVKTRSYKSTLPTSRFVLPLLLLGGVICFCKTCLSCHISHSNLSVDRGRANVE